MEPGSAKHELTPKSNNSKAYSQKRMIGVNVGRLQNLHLNCYKQLENKKLAEGDECEFFFGWSSKA